MSELIEQMVAYDGQEGKVDAYLAKPEAGGPYPGVVVIHEIYGLTDHIKDVASRFARQGCVALAPDLFSRPSLVRILTPSRVGEVMQFTASMPREKLSLHGFLSNHVRAASTVMRSTSGLLSHGRQYL